MNLMPEAVVAPMEVAGDRPAFSLWPGGPLYHLQRNLRLTHAPFDGALRRGALFGSIAWLPPVPLAIIDGTAIGAVGPASLLTDCAAWARCVIAVPLFVAV